MRNNCCFRLPKFGNVRLTFLQLLVKELGLEISLLEVRFALLQGLLQSFHLNFGCLHILVGLCLKLDKKRINLARKCEVSP